MNPTPAARRKGEHIEVALTPADRAEITAGEAIELGRQLFAAAVESAVPEGMAAKVSVSVSIDIPAV